MTISNTLGFSAQFGGMEFNFIQYIPDNLDQLGTVNESVDEPSVSIGIAELAAKRLTPGRFKDVQRMMADIGTLDEKMRLLSKNTEVYSRLEELYNLSISSRIEEAVQALFPDGTEDADKKRHFFYTLTQEIRAHVPEKDYEGSVVLRNVKGDAAHAAATFQDEIAQEMAAEMRTHLPENEGGMG
jgi:hypothetical protein